MFKAIAIIITISLVNGCSPKRKSKQVLFPLSNKIEIGMNVEQLQSRLKTDLEPFDNPEKNSDLVHYMYFDSVFNNQVFAQCFLILEKNHLVSFRCKFYGIANKEMNTFYLKNFNDSIIGKDGFVKYGNEDKNFKEEFFRVEKAMPNKLLGVYTILTTDALLELNKNN